jgi:hypothetical protein
MGRVFGSFAFKRSPFFLVENREIWDALNIIRIVLHDDASWESLSNLFDELCLELTLFHDLHP